MKDETNHPMEAPTVLLALIAVVALLVLTSLMAIDAVTLGF
ncbi:MAG: hypothetical protein R3C46_04530 [Hyphomonadaceae bacterium]